MIVRGMNGGLVSAVDWYETDSVWACSIVYHDGKFKKIELRPETSLSFSVQEGRFCTGYYAISGNEDDSPDSWKHLRPCPYGLEITRGTRCLGCRGNDVMIPCIRCDGSSCYADLEVQEKCQNSTAYVYLAAFRNRIKAGVSRDRRILKRWIEQGADAARIVLKGDGRLVRQYEKKIQTELGAVNHVHFNQKVIPQSGECIDVSLELLEDYAERVYGLLPEAERVNDESVNLLPYYRLPEFQGRPMPLKVKPGLQVNGRILGVKGPIVYIDMVSRVYALDTHRLISRRIELEDIKPVNVQSGLGLFIS